MTEKKILKFPDEFLWGTATSSHQVEGENKHNDWWAWENQGKIKDGSVSGEACDHYRLYEKDFELVKKLNQNAHRFSIEWSRIEPEEGKFDYNEINHYKKVLISLKEKGIKTMVTLHHFTNPLWLAEKGGWLNKGVADYFARYSEIVAKELNEYVDFWATINEPLVYATKSYLFGDWPPEKKGYFTAYKAFNNLVKAHKKSYQAIKSVNKDAFIGMAKNNKYFEPYRKNYLFDKWTVKLNDFIWNHLFLKKIKGFYNFIGLNYYSRNKLKFNFFKYGSFFYDLKNDDKEVNDLGWEIYPEGIYYVLMDLKKYNVPVYITENGLADKNDSKRCKFILDHLKETHRAIDKGVDVKGYFHWSLMDNFEWAEGFTPRFGLIEIDYKTLERIPRPSAEMYSQICKENAIFV